MTRGTELEGAVRSWLHQDGHEDADRVLFSVLDELETTPQRHASWLARRFPIMNSNAFRVGIAAAAVVVLAVIGWRYLPGSNTGGGPEATPSPTPQPTPIPTLASQRDLSPGTYQGRLHPDQGLGFTITVPAGWDALGSLGVVASDSTPPELAHGLLFWNVDNLYADPLDPFGGGLEPPVGPAAGDLVDALVGHDGWTTTAPEDVTVAGYDGRRLELTVPVDADFLGCSANGSSTRPFAIWSEPGTGQSWRCMAGPGQTDHIYVLDVEGRRVVITLVGFPDWNGRYLDELRAMVDSLTFFEAP